MTASKASSRRNTREEILDAAEEFFARKGYPGTTLDDVAAVVKIRRPSLLYHFPNKSALFQAVIDRLLEGQQAMEEEIFNAEYDSNLLKMNALIDGWLEWLAAHSNFANILLHNMASDSAEDFEFWNKGTLLRSPYVETLKAGIKSGEFRKTDTEELHALTAGYPAYFLRLSARDKQGNIDPRTVKKLKEDVKRLTKALLLIDA